MVKKLLIVFLLVVWVFFSYTFAVTYNGVNYNYNSIVFQTNRANFKNDYVLYNGSWYATYMWWLAGTNPQFYKSASWFVNAFSPYNTGSDALNYGAVLWSDYFGCETTYCSLPSSSHWVYITDTFLSIFPNTQIYWYNWQSTLSFNVNTETKSIGAMAWRVAWSSAKYTHYRLYGQNFPNNTYNQIKVPYIFNDASQQWSFRVINMESTNENRGQIIAPDSSQLAFNRTGYSVPQVETIQYFQNDKVTIYHWTNSFIASYGASANAQYFLGAWNSYAWVSPWLLANGFTSRYNFHFYTQNHIEDFPSGENANMTSFPYSNDILILAPIDYTTRENTYSQTVVAIAKDNNDPRKLVGAIYPYCNCTSTACLINYCTPSLNWHREGYVKYLNNDVVGSWIALTTDILPYNTTGAVDWVYLNEIHQDITLTSWTTYNNIFWSHNYFANPVPWLFFNFGSQKQTPMLAETKLDWNKLCFNGTWDRYCLWLNNDSTTPPTQWLNSWDNTTINQWLWTWTNQPANTSTTDTINNIVSKLEQTYNFTPAICSIDTSPFLYSYNMITWNTSTVIHDDYWSNGVTPSTNFQNQERWIYFVAKKDSLLSQVKFHRINTDIPQYQISIYSIYDDQYTFIQSWIVNNYWYADIWLNIISGHTYIFSYSNAWSNFYSQVYPWSNVGGSNIDVLFWYAQPFDWSMYQIYDIEDIITVSDEEWLLTGSVYALPYDTNWSELQKFTFSYCYYKDQLALPVTNEKILLSWEISQMTDTLVYGQWGGFYACPSNYLVASSFSFKISDFLGLSILENTALWNVQLLRSLSCFLGAYKVGLSGALGGDILSWIFTIWNGVVYEQWNHAPSEWDFGIWLSILFSFPALYLAFKLIF